MSKIDAVLTHNNATDWVLVNNDTQTALQVDREVFKAFCMDEQEQDWSNWGGPETWDGDFSLDLAQDYGDVIAYWQGGKLIIADVARWQERQRFYLGE